jgi:hypothetical protein
MKRLAHVREVADQDVHRLDVVLGSLAAGLVLVNYSIFVPVRRETVKVKPNDLGVTSFSNVYAKGPQGHFYYLMTLNPRIIGHGG